MSQRPHNLKCPGPTNRRTWMKLGGLSLGALAGGISPSLAQVLAAEKQGRGPRDDFSVILFWANGGPSHLDLFDLKPNAPSEIRGPFQPIQTSVPGMDISEMFPRIAQLGEKFTLLRSLHHERAQHSGGTHRFLSGYPSIQANLKRSEFPTIGSIVLKQLGGKPTGVPTFMSNTPLYGGGPAYLGPAYEAYMPNPNPLSASGANTYDPMPIYKTPASTDNLTMTSDGTLALTRRRGLLSELDRLPERIDATGMMSAMGSFQQQAVAMLSTTRMRDAFDLGLENEQTRQRYGDTHWGNSLLTCRRLVEAGVRFVQCQATFRLKKETGRTSNWDDHSVNSHIFNAYREKLPSFDQSVSALIEDLYQRGLNERVLFIFCGEFGRTPRIRYQDASKRPGRDHWPGAMSIFLSGGGLKMGQVIGATNKNAEEPVERIMNSNCLLSTLYHRFGIDTHHAFLNRAGRPIPILTDGAPIPELL